MNEEKNDSTPEKSNDEILINLEHRSVIQEANMQQQFVGAAMNQTKVKPKPKLKQWAEGIGKPSTAKSVERDDYNCNSRKKQRTNRKAKAVKAKKKSNKSKKRNRKK